ncbi:PaaI family thioesterase [Candidatus Halocynthiibacter alkanivorans]|uniref:PaaI family thioesterase n=1 Tax=Candidatus Halocynthiibacter alkanivorans TaxID=2267619 RepID=UPI000DF16909|nr:PaaI family thioesterase [Candidatus Halocynthiibacter alkanivorans]
MTRSDRKVDVPQAQAHFDTVLQEHSQDFETFFLARFLGLTFEYLPEDVSDSEKEVCSIRFPVTEMVMNPQGSLHGGVMATVMDISMGHLVRKITGPGATIEMKVQYLRPVFAGEARCEGRFTKKGRSISFMESRVWGPDGKLAAHATGTWKMP